mmetsp:Transcript_17205/g.49935  ORF Transcript_17205/g.49935 Transcript_17205/m.49935 type:complete len:225 (-) Transcript_17205:4149-4823(-)
MSSLSCVISSAVAPQSLICTAVVSAGSVKTCAAMPRTTSQSTTSSSRRRSEASRWDTARASATCAVGVPRSLSISSLASTGASMRFAKPAGRTSPSRLTSLSEPIEATPPARRSFFTGDSVDDGATCAASSDSSSSWSSAESNIHDVSAMKKWGALMSPTSLGLTIAPSVPLTSALLPRRSVRALSSGLGAAMSPAAGAPSMWSKGPGRAAARASWAELLRGAP